MNRLTRTNYLIVGATLVAFPVLWYLEGLDVAIFLSIFQSLIIAIRYGLDSHYAKKARKELECGLLFQAFSKLGFLVKGAPEDPHLSGYYNNYFTYIYFEPAARFSKFGGLGTYKLRVFYTHNLSKPASKRLIPYLRNKYEPEYGFSYFYWVENYVQMSVKRRVLKNPLFEIQEKLDTLIKILESEKLPPHKTEYFPQSNALL